MSEFIASPRIRCLEVRLLAPNTIALHKDIDCTRGIHRIVILVAVDSLCSAAFIWSSDRERGAVGTEGDAVTFECAAIAEMVAHFRIRGLDVSGLLHLRLRRLGGG